jgi:hypothetical protein
MGTEEGEEEQAKGIHNIFNKISQFRYRKPPGHQTDLTKIELPHNIVSLKQEAQRIEKEY